MGTVRQSLGNATSSRLSPTRRLTFRHSLRWVSVTYRSPTSEPLNAHTAGPVVRIISDQRLGLPDSPLGRRLRRHRGEDEETSDIDLLVDLDPTVGLVALAGLTRELHDLLGVQVDVVPTSALKPNVRRTALAEAIALRAGDSLGRHRYFDTDHAIVRATLDHDLPPLAEAVARSLDSLI